MVLTPWRPPLNGKFLISQDGTLHDWLVDENGVLHHDQAATVLAITSAIDGFIEPDGTCFVTARDPGCDPQDLMERASALATERGLGFEAPVL